MSVAVLTGAAGFIGSHLAEALVASGWQVRGVDSFTEYYPRAMKERNLQSLRSEAAFDLLEQPLSTLSNSVFQAPGDRVVVFHLAAQPGVRQSWADGFPRYVQQNILETQALLETATACAVQGVVYASSSSVYGEAAVFPTREGEPPAPRSPYGVTKHAGELLLHAYTSAAYLQAVTLRLFTVYGPRQRPDMAFHRLCEAALGRADPFTLFGGGDQVRDFTYVDDVIAALIAAGDAIGHVTGTFNVAGGSSASLREAVDVLEAIAECEVPASQGPPAKGDVHRTGGDTSAIRAALGWTPRWSLESGLREQFRWHQGLT